MNFSHTNLVRDLEEIKSKAIRNVNSLDKDDVLSCGPPCVKEIIRMHLIRPPLLGEFYVEDDVFEIVNASTDKKTGDAGLYCFFPIIRGEATLLSSVSDQKPDEYPLAFLDSKRIKIALQFNPNKESEEDLIKKINFRKQLVIDYVTLVQDKIVEFNISLAEEIFSCIQNRQNTLNSTVSALKKSGLILRSTGERERLEKQKNKILDALQTAFSSTNIHHLHADLRTFIVHGHDDISKLTLKNYLQNTLKLDEPIILHEQPSRGRTIIEKFEETSNEVNLVFVLLTPDDFGAKISTADNEKYRARQNVIFEMGYFLGKLGRKSGRVILLHKGQLELPSDIDGIVYINISNGIEAASEEIRKELSALGILK